MTKRHFRNLERESCDENVFLESISNEMKFNDRNCKLRWKLKFQQRHSFSPIMNVAMVSLTYPLPIIHTCAETLRPFSSWIFSPLSSPSPCSSYGADLHSLNLNLYSVHCALVINFTLFALVTTNFHQRNTVFPWRLRTYVLRTGKPPNCNTWKIFRKFHFVSSIAGWKIFQHLVLFREKDLEGDTNRIQYELRIRSARRIKCQ